MNPECTLQHWELAHCPKLQLPLGQVAEKAAEIIFSLKKWAAETNDDALKMRILGILNKVVDIPVILQDVGFDVDGPMERYTAELEAVHWVLPERSELLASLRPKTEAGRKHHDL